MVKVCVLEVFIFFDIYKNQGKGREEMEILYLNMK